MNNFYPMNNQFQSPYQPRINSNGIIWVQGIEGAKAFQLIPNSNAMLMDSENDGTFYIKVSDNVGMCNLRIFKYEEVNNLPKNENDIDLSNYITRNELQSILDKRLGGGKNNGKQSVQSTNAESIISK